MSLNRILFAHRSRDDQSRALRDQRRRERERKNAANASGGAPVKVEVNVLNAVEADDACIARKRFQCIIQRELQAMRTS